MTNLKEIDPKKQSNIPSTMAGVFYRLAKEPLPGMVFIVVLCILNIKFWIIVFGKAELTAKLWELGILWEDIKWYDLLLRALCSIIIASIYNSIFITIKRLANYLENLLKEVYRL